MTHAPRSGPFEVLGELSAAECLLPDPELEPGVGAIHLRRAWQALHAQQGAGEVAVWAKEQARRWAEPARASEMERAVGWLWEPATEATPTLETLLDQVVLVRSMLDAQIPRPSRWPMRLALIAFLGLGLAMAGSTIYSFARGPQGPWIGQYFNTPDFRGPWVRRDARRIEFDWGKKEPMDDIGEDQFSAIFRTCLQVEEQTEVRFRVSSDDGSRLLVNGELIVDNWGAHPTVTRTGKTVLEPGKHELRIDYFEAILSANLKLEVAMGPDEKFDSLSPMLLSQPRFRSRRPCA